MADVGDGWTDRIERIGVNVNVTLGFLDENGNWVPVSVENPLPTE